MSWANIIKIADEFGEEEGDSLFRQIEYAIMEIQKFDELNKGVLPEALVKEIDDAEHNIDELRIYVEDLLRGEE